VANKFEFKTQEGTYTRYSRDFSGPLIMLTRLSIRTVKKVRAFCIADHIRNGIGSPDTVGFDKYFQEFSGIILKGRRTLGIYFF
jgi:hypothetical protein